VRDDSGATEGLDVPIHYDPLISKLITWGADRPQAVARMRRALAEYDVHGIRTTIPFFRWALEDEDFLSGRFDTTFIDRKLAERGAAPFDAPSAEDAEFAAIAAALHMVLRVPSAAPAPAGPPSRWLQQARFEALR
jgi:acetyl/propionyl-CoA carboxylase alpha subunit